MAHSQFRNLSWLGLFYLHPIELTLTLFFTAANIFFSREAKLLHEGSLGENTTIKGLTTSFVFLGTGQRWTIFLLFSQFASLFQTQCQRIWWHFLFPSNGFLVGFPTVVIRGAGHRSVIRWNLTQDFKPGAAFSSAGALRVIRSVGWLCHRQSPLTTPRK